MKRSDMILKIAEHFKKQYDIEANSIIEEILQLLEKEGMEPPKVYLPTGDTIFGSDPGYTDTEYYICEWVNKWEDE